MIMIELFGKELANSTCHVFNSYASSTEVGCLSSSRRRVVVVINNLYIATGPHNNATATVIVQIGKFAYKCTRGAVINLGR